MNFVFLGVVKPLKAYNKTDMSPINQQVFDFQCLSCKLQFAENQPSIPNPSLLTSDAHCGAQVIGTINGTGRVVVKDGRQAPGEPVPEDLELEKVLGDMPNKTYTFTRRSTPPIPLALPSGTTAAAALDRVLRLLAVGSKRFLTSKVDRCVTGRADWTVFLVMLCLKKTG